MTGAGFYAVDALAHVSRQAYDRELQWLTAGILEPVDFGQLNRRGVAFFDLGGFGAAAAAANGCRFRTLYHDPGSEPGVLN
jgi:hypothetical protein